MLEHILTTDQFDVPAGYEDQVYDPYEIDARTRAPPPSNVEPGTDSNDDDDGGSNSNNKTNARDKAAIAQLIIDYCRDMAPMIPDSRGRMVLNKLHLSTTRWVRPVEKIWLWVKMPIYRRAENKTEAIRLILFDFFVDFADRRIKGVDFSDIIGSPDDLVLDTNQQIIWEIWHEVRIITDLL
jgi:hypothetical protein